MATRFKLYGHQRSGPTYKVALALSLMGEPFEYEHVDLPKGAHKEPGYLAKNRFGQVPCLYDGAHHFCQSASILQYLAEKGISVPAGWDSALAGGFGGISGDGTLMAGWSFGPLGQQSYIIQVPCARPLVSSGSSCTSGTLKPRTAVPARGIAVGS